MSSTSTALVSTPLKKASNVVLSLEKSAADLISHTAKTAQSLTSKPASPSTPQSLPPPSPGTFRHPEFTKIIERQSKNYFTGRNVGNATVNIAAIFISFFFRGTIYSSLDTIIKLIDIPGTGPIATIIVWLARLLFLANTFFSLQPVLPYVSATDEISDIALTPSQRSLLGLAPSSGKSNPSPLSTIITPPRYRRSSSSGTFSTPPSYTSTDRRSISANYSTSPLSTSRYTLGFSPTPSQPQPQSPYRRAVASPNYTTSPLLHKAITKSQQPQDLDFRSPSRATGLSRSQSLKERPAARRRDSFDSPSNNTTSPTQAGKRSAHSGLNYKWLYDRRLGGSGSGSPGRLSAGIGGGMVKSESMAF